MYTVDTMTEDRRYMLAGQTAQERQISWRGRLGRQEGDRLTGQTAEETTDIMERQGRTLGGRVQTDGTDG